MILNKEKFNLKSRSSVHCKREEREFTMTKAVNETLIERRKPRGPRDERERERLSETLIERREERYREVKKREREREQEKCFWNSTNKVVASPQLSLSLKKLEEKNIY